MPTTGEQGPGPIRVQVPLVIDMTAEQAAAYALGAGLPHHGGPLRVKDIVDDVQAYALTAVQDSPAFGESGGVRGAIVTIKGR